MVPQLVLIALILGFSSSHPQYGPPKDIEHTQQVGDPGVDVDVTQEQLPGIIPLEVSEGPASTQEKLDGVGVGPIETSDGSVLTQEQQEELKDLGPFKDVEQTQQVGDPGVDVGVTQEQLPGISPHEISEGPAPTQEKLDGVGVGPIESSDGSVLTPEQQDNLKDFWWKAEGTFGGDVVVKPVEQIPIPHPSGGAASVPFTPQQSAHCQAEHDCVPWEKCVAGSIYHGEPKIGHNKPTSYDELKCGQEGNMCCSIHPIQKPVIKNDPTIPLDYQCAHSSYDCVPYFQCDKGEINTDGQGLIDLRVRPTGSCINPEYPDVPAVCCHIPGTPSTPPPPPPLKECKGGNQCVDITQCSSDGFIVTDGTGLIDLRAGHPPCYFDNDKTGVCCSPPPVILEQCPPTAACVDHGTCVGKALGHKSDWISYSATGKWSECTLNQYGKTGICCELPPPPPVPEVLEHCPDDSLCTEALLCLGTALDLSKNFRDYSSVGEWSYCRFGVKHNEKGVCCIPPPPELIDCPSNSICVPQNSCTGTAMDGAGAFLKYDNALPTWSACALGKYDDPGLCCINKPPVDPLVPASQCGTRNYHIDKRIQSNYAKNEAAFGEFPWQSIIFFQNYTFKCGGSLISNRHVLTAAHCVQSLLPGDIKIRLGEWQVNSFDEPLPYEDHNVHALYIHPKYNPKNVHNDIAVLELAEPVKLQYHINTLCLPKLDQHYKNGDACYATGWGKDSFKGSFQHILKKIDLPFVEHVTCEALLKKTRLGKYFRLDKSFGCAGGEENKDACFGDGGGPLVCQNPHTGQYDLVGITAWGIECGLKDVPGVYANVALLSSWVDEIVHGFSQKQEPLGGGAVVGYGK